MPFRKVFKFELVPKRLNLFHTSREKNLQCLLKKTKTSPIAAQLRTGNKSGSVSSPWCASLAPGSRLLGLSGNFCHTDRKSFAIIELLNR
jgi:hypothetical protein